MPQRAFALLFLLLACLSGWARAAVVESVRTYRAPEYTRLVFDLDKPLSHKIFTLEDPDRVVIDLIDANLDGRLDKLDLDDTPIEAIRHAVRNGSDLRVVLDMKGKVQPRSFLLDKNEQYGERLVVDLYDADAGSEARQVTASLETLNNPKRDVVILVSAGHGGEDPGAIGVNRLREKDVVLAISREVAARINATPGFRAVMARDGDYYVGLRERVLIAHQNSADFYVAIHADAHSNKDAKGATLYALSQRGATSEQARLLAEKENAADLIGGVGSVSLTDKDAVLASVLLDLSMTASVATSLDIGKHLIDTLDNVVYLRRRNVEQASFVELKSADIPSLLVESGYITNSNDAKNLDSSAWRQQFAARLVDGIVSWFQARPPVGTLLAWQKESGLPLTRQEGSYTVQRGDSLSMIAERFGLSMTELKTENALASDTIRIGQVLRIPGHSAPPVYTEHKIKPGETLSQIAISYSVPLSILRETNQLQGDVIRVGQVLKIPAS
ncbi:MAG TPA: N-acetylmuramoyl-L-alanine amidase [Hyphomicrobiales bacterium]|nr:N-acetylmuramoyl-L-alanine amidase [Hyphomicrobiales bacterium]